MTRDENGRFVKGVSGNPGGRHKNEAAEMMREALTSKLTPARASKIATRLLLQCERGNEKAREQLFRFLGLFDDKLDVSLNLPGAEKILAKVYGFDDEPNADA